ncbi:MAG: GNAT family N-acetyltransferase [Actinomycetota bacterium]|nr:GNAT family N-acetyltransferase [Actinomycetota bacterium]
MEVIEVHRWPSDDTIAQLVVVDHRRHLDAADIRQSVAHARAGRPTAIRTGALFPDVADAFAAEGFHVIDTLALLTRDVRRSSDRKAFAEARRRASKDGLRMRPLRHRRLARAADVDQAAFGDGWGHNAASLSRIAEATPRSHQRVVLADRDVIAFAITGFGEQRGYLQRIAVEPSQQRRGLGRLLVLDSLHWLGRQGANAAMVNTGTDNTAALTLYETLGFRTVRDRLRVMELTLDG